MRHLQLSLTPVSRENRGKGPRAPRSQSCLPPRCPSNEQVVNPGRVSIWDAVSDLFMQPCVCQPGFRCLTKLWSDFQLTVEVL